MTLIPTAPAITSSRTPPQARAALPATQLASAQYVFPGIEASVRSQMGVHMLTSVQRAIATPIELATAPRPLWTPSSRSLPSRSRPTNSNDYHSGRHNWDGRFPLQEGVVFLWGVETIFCCSRGAKAQS